MTRLIAGSSSLIFLAKCGVLETVCDIFEVIVPSSVIFEVTEEGLGRKHPEASLILELVSKGRIKVDTAQQSTDYADYRRLYSKLTADR